MKIMKRHTILYYILLASLFAIASGIDFLFPQTMIEFPLLNWMALLLTAIMIITPLGSRRLQSPSSAMQQNNRKKWLTTIFLLEIGAFLLYFACTQFNATLVLSNHIPPTFFMTYLDVFLFRFGLFPWALIAIVAVSFGIYTYTKKQDTYLSDISGVHSILPQKYHDTTDVIIKTIARSVTIAFIAITLVMLTLICTSIGTSMETMRNITGFNITAMAASFLMLFITLRATKNPILLDMNKKKPFVSIAFTVLIWIIVLNLIGVISHFVHYQSPTPAAWMQLLEEGWPIEWHLFSNLWWTMLIPIVAIFIARASYGYSVRAVIIATLFLPSCIAVFLGIYQLSEWSTHFTHIPLWLVQLAGALGALCFFGVIYNDKNIPLTMMTYLSADEIPKTRNEIIYQQRLKHMCGLMFYFFLPAGVVIVSLILSLVVIPLILIIIAIHCSLWRLFSTRHMTS